LDHAQPATVVAKTLAYKPLGKPKLSFMHNKTWLATHKTPVLLLRRYQINFVRTVTPIKVIFST
jgi:hypothetical protein